MKKSVQIRTRLVDINGIESISHILGSIASIRIKQIKTEVVESRDFFQRLWAMYSQLRISSKDMNRQASQPPKLAKPAVVLITANAGLTGEVDTHVVERALAEVDPRQVDFFVLGLHGENLLAQRGIKPVKTFRFPEVGKNIDVLEITHHLAPYVKPVVYYPSYNSLFNQNVLRLELVGAIEDLGGQDSTISGEEIIFSDNCIFEPNAGEVMEYLQQMMASTILTEIILESNLAQLSSRFNAMTSASKRATDMAKALSIQYSHLKRHENDEANRRYQPSRKVTI